MTAQLPSAPFNIGDQRWTLRWSSHVEAHPCPTCFGTKQIELILGDGTHVVLPCETCNAIFSGPTGIEQETVYTHVPELVTIESVHAYVDGEWRVKCNDGSTYDYSKLFASYDEAMVRVNELVELAKDQKYDRRTKRQRQAGGKAASSRAYHQRKIADLMREIRYHEVRLGEIKVKAS